MSELHEDRRLRNEVKAVREKLKDLDELRLEIEVLKITVSELQKAITREMIPLLEDLARSGNMPPKEYQKYVPERNDSWNWKEHILYTLTMEERPLLSAELVDIHYRLEVRGKREKRHFVKDISRNLTALVRAGRVVSFKSEGLNRYFYCKPEWIEDGELKPEYFGRGVFI